MAQTRFMEIDPETTRSGYADTSDKFSDGEDVPMLITEASYDDQRDIYKMTLMEVGDKPRIYYSSIFMLWGSDSKEGAKNVHKAGQDNKISIGTIHDLAEYLFGVRQWMIPTDIEGGIIGVHFKVKDQYTNISFYRLSESFQDMSHAKFQQIFET